LDKAKRLIESQRPDEALALLKPFVNLSPRPAQADQAYLLMAAAYRGANQHAEAVAALNFFLSEFPTSPLLDRAKMLLASEHAALGHPDQALPLLAEIRSLTTDVATKREALLLTGDILAQKHDVHRAIQAWLEEMELAQPEQRGSTAARIQTLIRDKLDRRALMRVRDTYPTSFPGDVALIRLIEWHTARGEDHLAERQLRLFLQRFPSHDYAAKAADLLNGLAAKLKSSQAVLVALLPLSGKLAPFGTEVLNGIQLALEKAKDVHGPTSVGLIVKDSAAPRGGLAQDLTDTLEEYRPVAVLGPLLSKHLPLVAEVAARTDTPVITPSATVADVRRYGSWLFSTALPYSHQAKRIASYATEQLGYRRVSVLSPDTVYGRELAQLFSQELIQHGGEIIATESYKEGDTDFGQAIKRLKAQDLKKYGVTTPVVTSKGQKRDLYAPGFDAIFVPGRATDITLLSPQLVFHDVKVPLLGTSSWNMTPAPTVNEPALEGSVFVDGFFSESPDPVVQEFVDRYRQRFQTPPTAFAAQAFDAATVVLDALRKGATSGSAVREYLQTHPDLPTLGGPAHFDGTGSLIRRIFVVGIKGGHLVQIE
jgi:ABC-type branched-subunit amino acid transport system substrate-binding protein/predicted negative regulator of RcsB-dependent stress response